MKYTKTKAVLNQLVADLSQMSMIIHQTHWYMRGPNFLKLHPLMDEFMEEIDSQLDVISERLIALDGSPYSTLKEMVENTKIQDWPGEWDKTTPERLAHLVDGYRYLKTFTNTALKYPMLRKTSVPKIFSLVSKPQLRRKSG